MNTGQKAAVYGIAGLALAGIMIFSGMATGILGPSAGFNPGSRGSVSILLTDPPSVPEGVTAVYVSYSSLALHVEGLGESGWVAVGGPGTIETLGLVNLSQTISSSDAPSGRYNLLVFNISAATVTFNGANYSATVKSGKLVVPITGGLVVNSSTPSAALIDIQPTILNVGNQSSPDFVMATGARALQFPVRDVGQSLAHVGFKTSLADRGWFRAFSTRSDNLTISAPSLSGSSFSLSLSNLGSVPVSIRLLILTPASAGTRPGSAPVSLRNSIVFAVDSAGSLHLIIMGSGLKHDTGAVRAIASAGYQLSSGGSNTFSFTGAITTALSGQGVHSGTTYYIVVMGSNALSFATVTSS